MALLFNGTIWGLSWWPLRYLEERGLHGLWATAIVFLIGTVGLALIWPSVLAIFARNRQIGRAHV